MDSIYIVIAAAAAAALLIGFAWSRKTRKSGGKVTSLKKYRQKGPLQPCSLCRKKSAGLAFYADENGQVIGVCPGCKPRAERRGLSRL